ncbi:MAG: 5-bromo-4-chloroindolyl phosphate hydrolysis family protein [Clostridia bacterium]|nr:5-bromo-4-chloroindolyl phosphate hydrolysis family protein [Clostridia bacterium]
MSKKHDDDGPSLIAICLTLFFFPPVGVFLLLLRIGKSAKNIEKRRRKRQEKLADRYLAVIGGSVTMSIMSIASAMGVDYDTACKDMQSFMYEGLFPRTSYLDLGKGLFVLDRRYAPDEEPVRQEKPYRQQQWYSEDKPSFQQKPSSESAKAQPAKQEKAVSEEARLSEEEAEYLEKLRQIRAVNDAIDDEKVSAQIDHIERITGNIFELVVEQPQKKDSIHTFMNYYLPTTLKLLTAYSRLEKQKVSGENIDASKKNIEKLLDQLVWAFERQNDQMFAKDAIDISSDVKVMETMMAKDGLSEGKLPKDPFKVAKQGG